MIWFLILAVIVWAGYRQSRWWLAGLGRTQVRWNWRWLISYRCYLRWLVRRILEGIPRG